MAIAGGGNTATASDTFPGVQEAWEGKKETEEMVSVPEEGPRHCLSCNTSDGCPREKRGNRVGRADSSHQDATLEFLSTLTLPHPHPHPQSLASGAPLEKGVGGVDVLFTQSLR